jgi:hypothetical protein
MATSTVPFITAFQTAGNRSFGSLRPLAALGLLLRFAR